MKINRTLNQILLKIFVGVNYVSSLALDTGKSIPVVYRQLDLLRHLGVLKKARKGKKVVYELDWINLSDMISHAIIFDVDKSIEELEKRNKNSKILKEINSIIENLPADILNSPESLAKTVYKFFSEKKFESIIQDFFKTIDSTKKLNFDESIDMLIEVFGMMDEEEQKEFLKKKNITDKDIANFLKYCRVKYLQKQLNDPRQKLYRGLVE